MILMSQFLPESISLASFDWYAWVVLPIVIFLARFCDVTLGTLRIIFISQGRRKIAPLLGFFEVLIWIVIIGQLVQHLHSVTAYIGYAAGFAAGNYVGMWLEERLAFGTIIIRVIIQKDWDTLVQRVHEAGFGVTCLDGQGSAGAVKILYIIIKRQHSKEVRSIINEIAPNAFVTVEEVRSAEKGIFPTGNLSKISRTFGRKSK